MARTARSRIEKKKPTAKKKKPSTSPEVSRAPTDDWAKVAQEGDDHQTAGPLYFWKPQQPNGFLGQWYPSEWKHDNGEHYLTAEMWMMVQKARLFGDEAAALEMLQTQSPAEHKRLGRQVRGFDEKIWRQSQSSHVSSAQS